MIWLRISQEKKEKGGNKSVNCWFIFTSELFIYLLQSVMVSKYWRLFWNIFENYLNFDKILAVLFTSSMVEGKLTLEDLAFT